MKMKRIFIIGIMAILTGLILTKSINAVVLTSKPNLNKQSFEGLILNVELKKEIFNEIKSTKDKLLVVDKIIGDRRVKYWEHVIDNIFIKNDSMLLHMDLEYNKVLEYTRCWSNVEIISLNFSNDEFKENYLWKRKVVFPDVDDCGLFYTFYEEQEYPLFCWEVRYNNGNTIFYDFNETPIGYSVPAPSSGFAIQGYGDSEWCYWRENAQEWYRKWYGSVNSISSPSIDQISYFIKNESIDTESFYVIAHSGGLPTRFLANKTTYYTASQLQHDMANRSPMKLAVLCCCSAMTDTGPGTLSYEFRKGEMTDTVTIGYVEMGNCSDWIQSLDWQDYLFEKIDRGFTVKKAFDRACAQYPIIADYVKFVGDPSLKINDNISSISEHCYYDNFTSQLSEGFGSVGFAAKVNVFSLVSIVSIVRWKKLVINKTL
jgi:hypothetical protein